MRLVNVVHTSLINYRLNNYQVACEMIDEIRQKETVRALYPASLTDSSDSAAILPIARSRGTESFSESRKTAAKLSQKTA